MSMMYGDYLKDKFKKAKINFDIVEKKIPPFANEQKWFMVEKDKQIFEKKQNFEDWLDDFAFKKIRVEDKTPFFRVKELVEKKLTRIYFFDFNLPIEKVKNKFSSKGHELWKDIHNVSFLIDYLSLYDVPIVSMSKVETNPNSLEKIVEEGYYITFEVYKLIEIKALKGDILFNYKLRPSNVEFYYENGIIKFPYEPEKLDNIFLSKMTDIIKLIMKIGVKLWDKFEETRSDFYENLFEKLKPEFSVWRFFAYKREQYQAEIRFPVDINVKTKDEFMQVIDKICKIFIESFLGDVLEPTEDIDEKIKQFEGNLKIIEEMLTFAV